MAVINIDDAYILNETGAQVDKVTGLFTKDEDTTSGEKAFAQLNIGTAGSNRNLLDNPWFTVNQRGQSSYTGRVYGVDRWKEYGTGNTVTVTDNGITLPIDTNTGFQQYFDDTFIQGKTVTISFMTADGTVTSKTVTWPTSGANMTAYTNGVAFFFGTVVGKKGLTILTNAEVTIRAVKLELGSVSTLANDVPPDYGEELAKCQRYFQRMKASAGTAYIGTGVCFTPQAYCVVNLPVPLRTTSVTTAVNGALSVQIPGSVLTASGQSFYVCTPSTIMIAATISGATAGQACLLALKDSGNYIDISADL